MARQRLKYNVTVVASAAGEIQYSTGNQDEAWCTSVEVQKDGSLRLYEGLKQRVFHPAREWLSYTVRLAAPAPVPLQPRNDDQRVEDRGLGGFA